MRPSTHRVIVLFLVSAALLAPSAAPSQTAQVTAADYARAEGFLAPNVNDLVVGGQVSANWLDDDQFWYRNELAGGAEFILVDPASRSRERAFDHERLAAALSAASGESYEALDLPFDSIELSDDNTRVSFDADERRWTCEVDGSSCSVVGEAESTGRGGRGRGGRGGRGGGRGPTSTDDRPLAVSPDGTLGAFIRDWNLWVRDMESGRERALTTDGVEHFGYATDNAGWRFSDRAMVSWSPDSTKIATQQQDERQVGEMYFINTIAGHPTLRVTRYPLPGDPEVAMLHRIVIDVEAGEVTRLDMPPDYHRATLGDDIDMNDYQWSPDGSRLAIASVSRDHKHAWVSVADAVTGAVRKVMEERITTHYESHTGWRVLWETNELLWYSERDDWGHLYLYDLETGALKHQITRGDGPVLSIERLDEEERTIWFGANGREPGQDPYFRHFYRIDLDGNDYVSLTPDVGNHSIQLSPSGRYLVDTYSQPDVPPVVALRDADGDLVMPLEEADISGLLATGWQPPIPITMKARDGETDIYGLMFRPTDLDPSQKYPIVNQVYPGPQSGSTGSRSFSAARGDRQALAELGFIVVSIDGMGTPGRSKSFQDAYFGAMGRDNTIPDQIAGMQDLAARYPWIDLERVGIWGHSGGGFATTSAMFRYPEFFKVGIAESGNHDQRVYEDDWGERYQGLLERSPDGGDNYDIEANQSFAKDLQGRLLLAHGTMDTNVPPDETLLVVEALIEANKDFDLIMIPNAGHGYGDASNYMMRRRWDYFVKWLLGAEPPREYEIGASRNGGR
jgi:dipeptidyl aminopeptidase/acylaminoacyl peptidase